MNQVDKNRKKNKNRKLNGTLLLSICKQSLSYDEYFPILCKFDDFTVTLHNIPLLHSWMVVTVESHVCRRKTSPCTLLLTTFYGKPKRSA